MKPAVSLVLISFNMKREIYRTLCSLSPGYQLHCPDCQIILVDNGSRERPQAADFAGLGLGERLEVYHWPEPTPSPVAAINFGLAKARASLIGVWIDGARMASPGLVRACARAAGLHPRPVIATYNYHLGATLQYEAETTGYDEAVEDRLLASIGWPADGYRLFDIATADMRGGPAGPMLESNALFLPRAMWDELGGYDSRFASPGGGAANPDIFIRACALPGAQLIRIQHEATFHQTHGGVSTSATQRASGILKYGSREYYRIHGRPMASVRTPGWLYDAATDRILQGVATA